MAASQISTRRYGGNGLAATLATTLAVTTPALASDPQVHREGGDACAIAFMPQGNATLRLSLLRNGAGVDFLVAAGAPGDARFDLLANGKNFELFFQPTVDPGMHVFHLAGDELFLPALVSGTFVPFGPTRWEPPVTAFRLAGGSVAYAALRQCAASLAARAAPIAPTPPSSQARPYTATRPATRDSALAGSPARTAQPGVVEIALHREHSGTFVLMATLNNTITAPLMLDTGASDVSLPADLADRLRREGSLAEADFIRVATYRMADGRTRREPVYRLRSVSVGPLVIDNVECSIAPYGTAALLGQSFLKRFRSVMLDQARATLTLTP
jgi:clan AA aspartic protease (TIGR02281 family)